jgi:hypothetical protein
MKPFPENSLIGLTLALAHSTFYDALPANAERREPIAPAKTLPPKAGDRSNVLQRAWNALDHWFYRQHMKEREAYLAESKDIFEVERRLRYLELRRYY